MKESRKSPFDCQSAAVPGQNVCICATAIVRTLTKWCARCAEQEADAWAANGEPTQVSVGQAHVTRPRTRCNISVSHQWSWNAVHEKKPSTVLPVLRSPILNLSRHARQKSHGRARARARAMVSRGTLITVPVVCLIMFFVSQVLLQPFPCARRMQAAHYRSGFRFFCSPPSATVQNGDRIRQSYPRGRLTCWEAI